MDDTANVHCKTPKYGLQIKLDHEYPEKKIPNKLLKWRQVLPFIPMSIRYLTQYCKYTMNGKKPIMDVIKLEHAKPIYGCPLGGIGAGTIGRGFKGEFCRYQLCPGMYEYITVPENQFIINIKDSNDVTIFQSVLSTYEKPKKSPANWEWNLNGSDCTYTALYPRAWTHYDLSKYGIKLVCRQISPVIPQNYKDSSLPCAVFVWDIKNVCDEWRSVSITFTFKDTCDFKTNKASNDSVNFERYSDNYSCGVSLEHSVSDMPCTFTVAKRKHSNDSVTDGFCRFNTKKTAGDVWNCIHSKGRLFPGDVPNSNFPANAIGLSSETGLESGGEGNFEFCLVWDMPIVHFRNKGHNHNRYYTRFFGSEGIAGPSIATYALLTYKKWEEDIYNWQSPILEDLSLPDWYKGAIFNELYFITDGGTVWFDVSDHYPREDPRWAYGVFGYLEGHEYRMYNTYDVHFYASFALSQLWPRLQISLQYQFKETVSREINATRKILYCGTKRSRKVANSIPHDLGDPEEEPFDLINAYDIHDVSEWRDLNLKFILQVFRDVTLLRAEKIRLATIDKYDSLEYIDDIAGVDDDLYVRSTCQISNNAVFDPRLNVSTPMQQIDDKPKLMNGVCKRAGSDNRLNSNAPREKHVSVSSYDNIEDDQSHARHHGRIRHNSSGKVYHSQMSQCSESMIEAILIDDVVDADRYLQDMYPACRKLIDTIITWDTDGDGLIENIGLPDQTFDAWIMTGPSAYCGGLWLAVLQCMQTMACFQGLQDDIKLFNNMLTKGKQSFEKTLWNGKFYKFDQNSKSIMADQLCGHWYLRACGFQYSVFPRDNVLSALKCIYENNILKFGAGKLGAVNGYVPDTADRPGHVDCTSIQSEESWTGVTYGLSALMLYEGMTEEAFATAGGMHDSLARRFGLSFQTPEAIYENGNYRSIGYMRPLAIWAMQHAIIVRPPDLLYRK